MSPQTNKVRDKRKREKKTMTQTHRYISIKQIERNVDELKQVIKENGYISNWDYRREEK